MDEVIEIVARLEAATQGSGELDCLIAETQGWKSVFRDWDYVTNWGSPHTEWFNPQGRSDQSIPRYTGSLDAALTLVPDNYYVELKRFSDGWYAEVGRRSTEKRSRAAQKPAALALCIAALKARAASPTARETEGG